MTNKSSAITGALIVLILLVGVGFWVNHQQKVQNTTEKNPGTMVGGDRDEHGCIGSAGYVWDATKKLCVRPWEENTTFIQQEVQKILADKYSKPLDQVHITVTKSDATHAAGSVLFGSGGPGEGGNFLAVKINGLWQVVFDGNGSPDCNKIRQYNFPATILPNFCD